MTNARREAYHKAVAVTLEVMQAQADAVARDFGEDILDVLSALTKAVSDHFTTRHASVTDGRTALWRCRFRVYDAAYMDEPVGDSDDELPADCPGTSLISGLPNVAAEVCALARIFHGDGVVVGLSAAELVKRLRGLRPTLSRNGGQAAWRIHYDTMETFNGQSRKRGWLMRVDIIREKGDGV